MAYTDSLTYPTTDDDWLRKVLIGGVLFLLSFLVIPLFIVMGYLVETIRSSIADEDQLPAFDDWSSLLVDGLKAWVIGFVYMLVPLAVAAVLIGGSIAAALSGDESAALGSLAGAVFIPSLLSLVFGYFGTAGVVNFAAKGRFAAGFEIGRIFDVALDTRYAIPWLLSVVVFIAASVITSLLGLLLIVGAILSVFVFFYAELVAANLWGTGFAAASSEPVEPPEEAGDVAV